MKRTRAEKSRNIKVSGIIIPADWDSNGKVKAFAISTFNEKEYIIKYKDDGGMLEGFLGKKARVEGVLIPSETLKTIQIKMISVL